MLRFTGHDTFHCKEQWLLKGLQLIEKEGGMSVFKDVASIPKLGVGKNMVRSIQHWLRAFGVVNSDNKISELGKLLFIDDKLDPYLENEGSLWLLQYYLCKTEFASLYKMIFLKFFEDKATLEFSESQVMTFVNRELQSNKQKLITDSTFRSDFKAFVKTYVSPIRNDKTVEDDFNAPLLSLNLIAETTRKNTLSQPVYRVERFLQSSISVEIFAYCLLDFFKDERSISFDLIRTNLGAYLCLSNECLEFLIDKLCVEYTEFIYKEDAGVRQLQVKELDADYKINMLKKHYEL